MCLSFNVAKLHSFYKLGVKCEEDIGISVHDLRHGGPVFRRDPALYGHFRADFHRIFLHALLRTGPG